MTSPAKKQAQDIKELVVFLFANELAFGKTKSEAAINADETLDEWWTTGQINNFECAMGHINVKKLSRR